MFIKTSFKSFVFEFEAGGVLATFKFISCDSYVGLSVIVDIFFLLFCLQSDLFEDIFLKCNIFTIITITSQLTHSKNVAATYQAGFSDDTEVTATLEIIRLACRHLLSQLVAVIVCLHTVFRAIRTIR